MSERVIKPEHEFKVRAIMEGVEKTVRTWPGLLSIETLVDTESPNKHVVITEWEDKQALKNWQKSEVCRKIINDLDKIESEPVKYRELMFHEDNVFLL